MGAWGEGPFENDDAGDFWYNIRETEKPLKYLEKTLNDNRQGYENERRAAAAFIQFLLRFDRRSLQRLRKVALQSLRELKSDEGFIETWRDEAAVKRELNKEIRNLNGS
jgi:hypothetical protein